MLDRSFGTTPDADDGCLTGMSLGSTTTGRIKEKAFLLFVMALLSEWGRKVDLHGSDQSMHSYRL